MHLHILKNGISVEAETFLEWEAWVRSVTPHDLQPFVTDIGNVTISTAFLPCGTNTWETMVFGGLYDLTQDRCNGSVEQAGAMHTEMVRRVLELIEP